MLAAAVILGAALTIQTAEPLRLTDLPAKWQRLAVCESSNRPHVWSPSGEHYGYFQIHRGFFNVYNYKPGRLGLRKQYEVALYVYKRQGPGAWSCAKKARFK